MHNADGLMVMQQIVSAAMQPMARVAKALELTESTWPLVWWLGRTSRTCAELARCTCRERQSVQRSLEWLEVRGLAVRVKAGQATRRWLLTEKGAACAKELARYENFFEECLTVEFGRQWPELLESLGRARDLLRTGRPSARGVGYSMLPPPVFDSEIWNFQSS